MRYAAFVVLLFAVPVLAQNQPCATLRACRAEVQRLATSLQAQSDRVARLEEDNHTLLSQLKQQDEQIQAANKARDEAVTRFNGFRDAVAVVLNQGNQLIESLLTANKDMTDKYNSLLQRANAALNDANSRLARQNRISNALAMYSLMPKYSPPQTLNLNVTNCNALPALCVH
jgi:chromosome segregation ATPase